MDPTSPGTRPARSLLVALTSAAVAAALAALAGPASPADAALSGGSVQHGVDQGYDAPILVRCGDESSSGEDTYSIREGEHSDDVCPDEDVDAVYTRYDEELWCWHALPRGHWEKDADATGWHPWGEYENRVCVLHRD